MKHVRYPVKVKREQGDDGPTVIEVEIDDLANLYPETFERWVSLECAGTDEQIMRVALAQAYHAQDCGLELAADALRSLSGLVAPVVIARVDIGEEESMRDALYRVSSAMTAAPRWTGAEHVIARARLLAAFSCNEIDTKGNEDPAKMRMESRR